MTNMKQTIRQASIDLFYKKGYFATSISDIARASGIQKASIYYHFSNKEDILFDILKTSMVDLDAYLEKRLSKEAGADQKIRAAIESHVIFHMDRQKEVLIADSELRGLTMDNYRTILRMRDDYESKFHSIIQKGIAEGVFEDIDPKIASYAILTMCTAVSSWFRQSGRLSKEEIAGIYAKLLSMGLNRDHR